MITTKGWAAKVEQLHSEGLGYGTIAKQTHMKYHPDLSECAEISRVRRYIDKLKHENNNMSVSSINETKSAMNNNSKVEYKADGTLAFEKVIAITEGEAITPEIVMKAHNLDSEQWTVVSFKNNYWQSQAKGSKKIVLYQSKIVVKPRALDDISLNALHRHFDKFTPKPIKTTQDNSSKKKVTYTDNMYELNICDLHLGKLAWIGDCGEEYNHEIATERFNKIIQHNINRIKEVRPEKILFVWCNDFFNSDGISNATTGGTPQDTDLRWQNLFTLGCDLLVNAIESLQELAPVESFYIASNHSRQVEFYALCYVYAWFRNNTRVTIHKNYKARYFVKYGINMIGFSHSYYEKKTNLAGLMSVEQPEMWATTKVREFHLGHYHCEQTDEKSGVILRWLPSMTGTDNWHYDCGYVGAVKRSYSFVWNKHFGLADIVVTNTFI